MLAQGHNEGFRVLDDFVCEATHASSIPLANPTNQGRSEGVLLVEELVVDLGTQAQDQPSKDDDANCGRP